MSEYGENLFYKIDGYQKGSFFLNDGPCEAIFIGKTPIEKVGFNKYRYKILRDTYKRQDGEYHDYHLIVIERRLYKCKLILHSENDKVINQEMCQKILTHLKVNPNEYHKSGIMDLVKATRIIIDFIKSEKIKNNLYGEFGQNYWFLYKVELMTENEVINYIDNNKFAFSSHNIVDLDIALEPFKESITKFLFRF